MADQISLFGVVVGVALLLAGLGFAILSIGGALRNPDSALKGLKKSAPSGRHQPRAGGLSRRSLLATGGPLATTGGPPRCDAPRLATAACTASTYHSAT